VSYVQRVLQPNERILFVSRLHWLIYAPAVFLLIIALGAAAASRVLLKDPNYQYVALGVCALIFLVGFVQLLEAAIRRITTEIAVTDKRIIYKTGLIRRHTIEMNMDKVESVDVDQSVSGRIFNFGTILIRGTGSDVEPLRRIENPIEFRNHVTAR
jgi:uncharacterized membrane protein YdbT with pleckstrin-like domain